MNQSSVCYKFFKTSDLNLAAYLRCCNFDIEEIKHYRAKAIFAFKDTQSLQKAIMDYANNSKVPARTLCNTLRDLKGLIR